MGKLLVVVGVLVLLYALIAPLCLGGVAALMKELSGQMTIAALVLLLGGLLVLWEKERLSKPKGKAKAVSEKPSE